MGSADHQTDSSEELAELGRTFALLHRRWARQARRVRLLAAQADDVAAYRGIALVGRNRRQKAALESIREEVGYHAAWTRWSASYDDLAAMAAQIGRSPAATVADLVVKFDALSWFLLDDGALVDREAAGQVRLFRRALARLAPISR